MCQPNQKQTKKSSKSGWIAPQEVGVSSCLGSPDVSTRCVNTIAFFRLSKESCTYKLIIQPSFFLADLLSNHLSKYLSATVVTKLLYCECCHCSQSVTPVGGKLVLYSEERLGLGVVGGGGGCEGSDGWRAVANLHIEFVRCPGQRRLLQHVVLHDHLLVGVDRGVCVVRVVP